MKEAIWTDRAPAAIGPYSQAIRVGDAIYTSGQLGLTPESGEFPSQDTAEQAYQALENLSQVLAQAGASMADVVKTTVFLVDMADFAAVNAVDATFFTGVCPARSAVQVAALPKGGKVEIEAVAVVGAGR